MAHTPASEYSSSAADLVYAVSESGEIVHVSEVSSGLACGCRCPACNEPVIAHKGSQITYHFKHQGNPNCRNGPETALHLLAKKIIEQELRLRLPAVVARYGNAEQEIYAAKDLKFTSAQLEFRELGISRVPDLFVKKSERKLFVEICVTNPCDESKRCDLERNGIATVEIDLSKFPRNASRDEIAQAVLEEAPRHWVYHPQILLKIEEMRSAHDAAEQRNAQKFKMNVEQKEAAYITGLDDIAAQPAFQLDSKSDILRSGFGTSTGIPVDGVGCFTVTAQKWQYFVLEALVPREGAQHPAYRVTQILDSLKKQEFIRPAFSYVSPEIEKALISRNIGFLGPYKSIEKYFEELCKREIVYKRKGLYAARRLFEAVNKLREGDTRRESNRKDLLERGEKILDILPEAERKNLTGRSWLEIPLLERFRVSLNNRNF
jgi:Competence protein CoiA-like family